AVAIEVIDDINSNPPIRRVIWHYDLCIFCGQCERLCTTEKGVKLSNKEFDLATLDRKTLISEIKKELLICQHCGTVIAPIDQILWLTKKLEHMTYGNYLAFTTLQELLRKNKLETSKDKPLETSLSRDDLFSFSCPKCRRQILLFDEYGLK
ncbi:MAG: 4Fe-4S binding protein, partial [Endomicrobiia bacterium]